MIPKLSPLDASKVLKNGGTAIYPTEGIYGLGCDPFNSKSVENIFKAKGRSKNKSFIILGSDIKYFHNIIDSTYIMDESLQSESFTTWIVPSNENCPPWLKRNNMVAIRLTKHETVMLLCDHMNAPIISTSANLSNSQYDGDIKNIEKVFDEKIDCVVKGILGNENKPSTIKNIITKEVIRA